jgi:catechol 2,3-dioxygenase-like lactoylglutathione lyase family enzyme
MVQRPIAKVSRAFINICTEKLRETRDFYTSVFGFVVDYDSDWFVHLKAPGSNCLELGIIKGSHEIVPTAYRSSPRGVIFSIIVDDADAVCALAKEWGVKVVEEPRDLFYGQRRTLLEDPNGMLVDASAPVARPSS